MSTGTRPRRARKTSAASLEAAEAEAYFADEQERPGKKGAAKSARGARPTVKQEDGGAACDIRVKEEADLSDHAAARAVKMEHADSGADQTAAAATTDHTATKQEVKMENVVDLLAAAEADKAAMAAAAAQLVPAAVMAQVLPGLPPVQLGFPQLLQQPVPLGFPLQLQQPAQFAFPQQLQQPAQLAFLQQLQHLQFGLSQQMQQPAQTGFDQLRKQVEQQLQQSQQQTQASIAVPTPGAASRKRKGGGGAARRRRRAADDEDDEDFAPEAEEAQEAQPKRQRAPRQSQHALDEPTTLGSWALDPHLPLIYRAPASTPSSRVAAMSLDGVVCNDSLGRPFAGNETNWQWAYPGVPAKLAQLVKHGYTVAIFNNQGNIRGALTGKASSNARGKVDAILDKLAQEYGVDTRHIKVFLSPEGNAAMGQMRKPATGMWTFFETSCNGGVPVDLSQSYYVGSTALAPEDDWDFAEAVGLKHIEAPIFFKSK